MAKKVTLFSFSAEKRELSEDPVISVFLGEGDCLVIGAAKFKARGRVTIVDDSLDAIKSSKESVPSAESVYSDFFAYAKRTQKNSFDYVVDNGYSSKLRRSELSRFYRQISKLLKYDGKLLSKALSTQDPYCKEHCPSRHWTYIGEMYVNFFTKNAVARKIERFGLKVSEQKSHTYEGQEPGTYHILVSEQKSMKL